MGDSETESSLDESIDLFAEDREQNEPIEDINESIDIFDTSTANSPEDVEDLPLGDVLPNFLVTSDDSPSSTTAHPETTVDNNSEEPLVGPSTISRNEHNAETSRNSEAVSAQDESCHSPEIFDNTIVMQEDDIGTEQSEAPSQLTDLFYDSFDDPFQHMTKDEDSRSNQESGCSTSTVTPISNILPVSTPTSFNDEPGTSTDIPSTSTPVNNLSTEAKLAKKAHEDFTRKRDLIVSVMNSDDPDIGLAERWGSYMHLKKTKLQYQVNVLSKPKMLTSNIFEGVSIFVNGHTDPSALELRELIQTHGGEYHCYLEYGRTTYTIASSLASAKVNKARQNEIFLLPNWIVDSISLGKKQPIDNYILHSAKEAKNVPSKPITNFFSRPDSSADVTVPATSCSRGEKILDARDPNFLQEYYARSRLHLISTLAQEMKDYVNGLREDNDFQCTALGELDDLKEDSGPSESIFFHVDLDCFFVSVALRSRPDLAGKPVAITHSKGSTNTPGMSEIASASYPARLSGIKNGMLVRDALKLCPTLLCLPYSFDEYREVSKTIYTIVARYCKEIRAVSCDEMYVNMTTLCTENRISNVMLLAEHIRAKVKQETQCAASVGIGPTVLMARLATRCAKPDGVRWIRQHEVVGFIANEKVENLPGIGRSMMAKLEEVFGQMESCRDLQNVSESELSNLFGKKVGIQIYKLCRGEDNSAKDFLESTVRKSVSCDINYGIRFTKKEEAHKFLRVLAAELEKKLKMCRMVAGSLTLKIMVRSADAPIETAKYLGHGRCDTFSKSVLFKTHSKECDFLFEEAVRLLDQLSPNIVDLRGIGVHCGRLKSEKAPSRTETDMRSFFRVRRPCSQRTFTRERPAFEPLHAINSRVRKSKFGGIVERELPFATCTPVLFGETDAFRIRETFKEMLLFEPSESVVFAIVDYFLNLLFSGHLTKLLSMTKFLNRLVYSNDCHESWFFAVNYLFWKLDILIDTHHGSPMIASALKQNFI